MLVTIGNTVGKERFGNVYAVYNNSHIALKAYDIGQVLPRESGCPG